MNDNRKRDIFYGIVAVATLIIALIGATLAYFSISVRSSEGAVNATAAIVSIEYNDGQSVIAQASELIPASLEVVKGVYEHNLQALNAQAELDPETIGDPEFNWSNVCLDAHNREVCSIYRFSLANNITNALDATGILQTEYNGFEYLAYAVRDVTNNSWLVLDEANNAQMVALSKCDNASLDDNNKCYTINEQTDLREYKNIAKHSIFGYDNNSEFVTKSIGTTKQVYDLVIFINENGRNQNVDQGKTYSGTIVVDIVDDAATRITGENFS